MHFDWNKNKPAFLVECDFDFYAFKFTVRIQGEPPADCLTNGLFGFALLNPIMLCVGRDNFPFDNFVIGIKRIERCFDRAVRGLKNHRALFMPLDMFKNMIRGFLQPILRSAVLIHMRLLKMHNVFNDSGWERVCAGNEAASIPRVPVFVT